MHLNLTAIQNSRLALTQHPLLVGNVIRSVDDVRIFMEHHVYAVWDFMCLMKTLQHAVVPSTTMWIPTTKYPNAGRFINETVVSEETDIDPYGNPCSHYDLYIRAMTEIGADTKPVLTFIDGITTAGLHSLNQLMFDLPGASEKFCRSTFNFIGSQKSHVVAAAFAFGRETIIPAMFTGVVDQLRANGMQAPLFEYYLNRHIQIDGEDHGPASLLMVEELCEGDPVKFAEAETAALEAISHRIVFWTSVQRRIEVGHLQ